MDSLGDQFLSRTAISLNVHGRIELGNAAHHIENRPHFAAPGDDVGKIKPLVENTLESCDLGIALAIFQRSLDLQSEICGLERLGHIAVRAATHSIDRVLNAAV